MSVAHEYAILGGINRARVGRYLAILAAGISAASVLFSSSLAAVLQEKGLPREWFGWAASALSASVTWAVLYWLLDNFAWQWPVLGRALGVPNLRGRWRVSGETLNSSHEVTFQWQGTLTITQRWDKIRVRLQTSQSSSISITAAILSEEDDGWRLLYTYRNEPRIGESSLSSHRGSADIVFDSNLQSAVGEYFNGAGRFTFGRMDITRDT